MPGTQMCVGEVALVKLARQCSGICHKMAVEICPNGKVSLIGFATRMRGFKTQAVPHHGLWDRRLSKTHHFSVCYAGIEACRSPCSRPFPCRSVR